ncbi:complex I NDUFA9 subunit family protein [Paenibacillus thermotolerans]|uniref:complex I NDUFA9 subunit family protein n=1 Tax=Paenibacillus thermotolerans TaxID=3027807 RepID=UPI002367F12F|nr:MULTISPECIES: complex I NDUFA9 subunit family protein [unclassified Paenibacillus]
MRVFLTGASGYVGSAILSKLVAQGFDVCCLVRRRKAGAAAGGDTVTEIEGDLLKPETYEHALGQCDAVIHLVGIIRENPRKGVTFERIHKDGTGKLIDACARSGFAEAGGNRRFIHMSALGARQSTDSAYFRTKWEAEERLRASGIPYVIFRPSVIFGPRDEFVNMLAGLVKLPLTPVIGDGQYRMQPVSLSTVSDVFVKALTEGPTGAAFDVGGPDQLTYDNMLREIAAAMGRSVRLMHVPLPLMKPAVALFERFPLFPITRTQLSMLLDENICREGTPFYDVYKTDAIRFADGIREYIRP